MKTPTGPRDGSKDDDLECVVLGLRHEFDRSLAQLHERLGLLFQERGSAGQQETAAQIQSMLEICGELRDQAGQVLHEAVTRRAERPPELNAG